MSCKTPNQERPTPRFGKYMGAKFVRWLAKSNPKVEVHGVDLVKQQRIPDQVSFSCQDTMSLGYKDASSDQITCTSTLEHIGPPFDAYNETRKMLDGDIQALEEIRRVLRDTAEEVIKFVQALQGN